MLGGESGFGLVLVGRVIGGGGEEEECVPPGCWRREQTLNVVYVDTGGSVDPIEFIPIEMLGLG